MAEASSGPPITFSNLLLRTDSDVQFAGGDYRVLMLEVLRDEGLNAVGAENLLFGTDHSNDAQLVLGGTVREAKCKVEVGSHPECCTIGVRWELLDVASNQVVYRVLSRFGECYLSLFPDKVADKRLLVGAMRALVNREGFKRALKARYSMTEAPRPPEARFTRCSAAPAKLSKSADPALDATVMIKVGNGHGSGFFLNGTGLVMTAAHVAAAGGEISVVAHSGVTYPARLVRYSKASDVALLAIDPEGGKPVRCLAPSSETQLVGKEVYAIGAPASDKLAFSLTRGIISGVPTIEGRGLLQTDASVSPGNSGGPLVDDAGRVLGVVSSKIAGGAVEGVAFGVPILVAMRALSLSPVKEAVSELEHAPTMVLAPSVVRKDDTPDAMPEPNRYIHVSDNFSAGIVDRVAIEGASAARGHFLTGFGGLELEITGAPATSRDQLTVTVEGRLPPPEIATCNELVLFFNQRPYAASEVARLKGRDYKLRGHVPVSALRSMKGHAPSSALRMCNTEIRLAPTQVKELKKLLDLFDELAGAN